MVIPSGFGIETISSGFGLVSFKSNFIILSKSVLPGFDDI
jgi:hypothetical protein